MGRHGNVNTGEQDTLHPETVATLTARDRLREVVRAMPEFVEADPDGVKMTIEVEGFRFVALLVVAPVKRLDG